MHPERTFRRGEVTVTTSKPATATQLIGEGWEEVEDHPTERPEPGTVADVPGPISAQVVDALPAEPTGIPTVDADSRINTGGRRARREATTDTSTD